MCFPVTNGQEFTFCVWLSLSRSVTCSILHLPGCLVCTVLLYFSSPSCSFRMIFLLNIAACPLKSCAREVIHSSSKCSPCCSNLKFRTGNQPCLANSFRVLFQGLQLTRVLCFGHILKSLQLLAEKMEETEVQTFVVTCSGLNSSLVSEIVSLFLSRIVYRVGYVAFLHSTAFSACQWDRQLSACHLLDVASAAISFHMCEFLPTICLLSG